MEIYENLSQRLKVVFDVCDTQKKGYISVEHFINLAKEQVDPCGNDSEEEDIRRVVGVLDPEGDGRIHFAEFLQGVKQIMELKTPTSPTAVGMLGPHLEAFDKIQLPEEDALSCDTHENSESTFNEYDMMTDDDASTVLSSHGYYPQSSSSPTTGQHTHVYSEEDQDSAFSGKSFEGHDQRFDQVSDEGKFEDYGDGEDMDSAASALSPSLRLKSLQVPQGNKRLSTNALANQLYRSGSGASRRSSCSDEIYDDIDGNFVELNDKVQKLESQIWSLNEKQVHNDQRHVRLKEENASHVERVHLLEEQLHEVEAKAQKRIEEEQRKHRDSILRTDKEKGHEIELLTQSLQHIEKEYQSLKTDSPQLRAENDRLRKDLAQLEQKLTVAQQHLATLAEEHQQLHTRWHQDRSTMDQERMVHAQLIDELSKELDELRTYRSNVECGATVVVANASNELPRRQHREIEAHMNQLKEENRRLREQGEDLQAQLISGHVQEGRGLLLGGTTSLADEMESLPKDELLKTIKEQQDENAKLREYIDRITLKILEKNPAILEVPIHLNNIHKKVAKKKK